VTRITVGCAPNPDMSPHRNLAFVWFPHDDKTVSQVAAPAEMRTPNMRRAEIAQQRVRMEGWRQRRPGSNQKTSDKKKKKPCWH